MKYKSYLFIILSIILFSCVSNSRPIGMSPYIFKDTRAWKAAKAVMSEDTSVLIKEIKEQNLVDFTDSYYGHTLLTIAIMNAKIKSVEALLKCGFDPNFIADSLDREKVNPVIIASEYISSPEILELVLKYGGDPNSSQEYILNDDVMYPFDETALTKASYKSLEKVKILVKYGANLNPPYDKTPLEASMICNKFDITLYLIQNGADYRQQFKVWHYGDNGGKELVGSRGIENVLRGCIVSLNSDEYKYKMKVVDFLKQHGIDYRSAKIPEHILKRIKDVYPDSWEEYIKVY